MSHTVRAVSARSRAPLAILFALILAVAGLVYGAAPARADVPDPPVAAPFNAPLCEGETPNDPTDAWGDVADLTLVFGQRLTDYNNGQVVHLYASDGTNGGLPSCTVRHIDGIGAVSEWAYCTDIRSASCTYTDEDGASTGGGLVHLPGNERLTPEQERIISYIVQNDLPVVGSAGEASNATEDTRDARQDLVWCVSDPGRGPVGFCEDNMQPDEQARILALTPEQAELTLELDPESTDLQVGETARIDVTTNVYNQPISVDVTGEDVTVCEGAATFENGELTVEGTDAATSSTITLCITSDVEGSITISGSATPPAFDRIAWVQAPGTDELVCQVFSAFETTRPATVSSSATVQFRAAVDADGGFSVVKEVAGDAASDVPADTAFSVDYAVDGGEPQSMTVVADGDPVVVDGLDEGVVVSLAEVDLPEIDGVEWGTPVFTVDGVESSSVTIGADQTVAVVLTNTADAPAPIEPEPTPEPEPAPEPENEPEALDEGGLAVTGGTWSWGVAAIGLLVLLAGGAMTAIARRHA